MLPEQKRRPPKRPPHMLSISPVLVRPAINVPRTILIGLTDAALNSPTRPAGPSTTAIVVVIAVISVMAVTVIPICSCWNRATDYDYAQCRSDCH
jgi:hypothetical protein